MEQAYQYYQRMVRKRWFMRVYLGVKEGEHFGREGDKQCRMLPADPAGSGLGA